MCRSILPDCKPKTVRIMNRQEDDKLVLYGGHRLFVMELMRPKYGICAMENIH